MRREGVLRWSGGKGGKERLSGGRGGKERWMDRTQEESEKSEGREGRCEQSALKIEKGKVKRRKRLERERK